MNRTRPTCLVVTPVRNAEGMIAETMRSVLTQKAVLSGRVHLHYVVVDGDSKDQTVTIARGFTNAHVVSAPDGGMYDALRSGWALGDSEPTVCAYINAGDLWHESALDVVLDVFEQRPEVDWITGYRAAISPEGYYVNVSQPYAYRRDLIQAGVYGADLPSIQQEATFWRGRLLAYVDVTQLASFRLAGDQLLWASFAARTELVVVCALLGGYRMHSEHLSSNRDQYLAEFRAIADTRRGHQARVVVHRVLWSLPDRMKKMLGGRGILSYHELTGTWRPPVDRLPRWMARLLTRSNR